MAGTQDNDSHERRQLRRHPAATLKASLQVKSGMFSKNWIPVQPLDYNKHGLAIDTKVELKPEQEVLVGLELTMDMGNIQIEKVAGVVRYVKTLANFFRYGIEFDFEGPRFMRSSEMESQLSRIENILERSQSVSDRIQSQQASKGR